MPIQLKQIANYPRTETKSCCNESCGVFSDRVAPVNSQDEAQLCLDTLKRLYYVRGSLEHRPSCPRFVKASRSSPFMRYTMMYPRKCHDFSAKASRRRRDLSSPLIAKTCSYNSCQAWRVKLKVVWKIVGLRSHRFLTHSCS